MHRFLSLIVFSVFFVAQPAHAKAPQAGSQAPDFSLTSVTGEQVALSDLKGKVVLIGMFHICVPCMNQAMEFNEVRHQVDSDKLVILGINTSGDSKEAVLDYLKGFPEKVKFSYLLDPGQSVNKAYIQRDMPTVLIIDSTGILRARAPAVGAGQLVPFIKELL
ncbi:MAG: TlpA disulfide reductase family protein [Nitrospinaceae bacterium]|nr:TlpA disulfide reductase family protein [Nitrospinaceae bacterium]